MRRPSAIVRGSGTLQRSPDASERRVSSPSAGSTPTISTPGWSAWSATAQPAMSPPPEIGA
jgi:hypothetical protein